MKRLAKHARRKNSGKRQRPRTRKSRFIPPQTVEEFFSMPKRDQDFWTNIGQAVTEVRKDGSLRQASLKFNLDQRKVIRHARPALRKLRNGRWAAKPHDRLLRVLLLPTRTGLREVGTRDSRDASRLGKFWTAVERYRDTGDSSALREFRGMHIIDSDGKEFELLTDLAELDRLGSAGVLSFESLYARAA